MTQLLERAFAETAKLPPQEQDAIARMVLEELAAEQRWSEAFEKSKPQLAALAEEALAEFRNGKTKRLEESL